MNFFQNLSSSLKYENQTYKFKNGKEIKIIKMQKYI